MKRLQLDENMRVQCLNKNKEESEQFVKFLLSIGNGDSKLHDKEGNRQVVIPDSMCVWSLEELISATFPNIDHCADIRDVVDGRVILSTMNEAVDMINNMIIDRLKGTVHEYKSIDSIKEVEGKSEMFMKNIPSICFILSSTSLHA